ncbi:MAG: lamin tail domain-containing protein, partial [Candidatus Cryptobacteroides sp.]
MKKTFIISIILLLSSSLYAQNVSDLIISEIMADGDSSITDDYGRKVGWIEIFNKSRGTVNYGGCFLTDDKSDLKKSLIPKGDARTKIGARQSVIFFASGRAEDGIR